GFSLRLRALAERNRRLYAAPDGLRDGFALGVSDDGAHFVPLLRFLDIRGPLPCVAAVCSAPWAMVRATLLGSRDAGVRSGGGSGGGQGGDCGCALGRAPITGGPLALLGVALILGALARKAKRL